MALSRSPFLTSARTEASVGVETLTLSGALVGFCLVGGAEERRKAAGGSTPKTHRRRQTATPAKAPTALAASHGVRDRRFAVLDSRGDRERGVRGPSSSTAA